MVSSKTTPNYQGNVFLYAIALVWHDFKLFVSRSNAIFNARRSQEWTVLKIELTRIFSAVSTDQQRRR